MKLLRGEVETIEQDGIKLVVKVIDGVEHAKISQLNTVNDADDVIYRISYYIRNVLESIEIDGQVYSADDLTYIKNGEIKCKVDNSDEQTRKHFLNIGNMVNKVIFARDEDVKKSQPQPEHGLSESPAVSAH
jgi:hydrogenase maturation factor HypE